MSRVTQIRRRDGRVVPFDRRRVADSIYRAAESAELPGDPASKAASDAPSSVSGGDAEGAESAGAFRGDLARFLAEELAGVVAVYLERTHGGRIPAVADVEDAVERVLVDTGHVKAAKAFVRHRDRRRAARERVVVDDERATGTGVHPLPLVGGESGGPVRAWSKSRIVDALVSEGGLDVATAEDVAQAVEDRILASGAPRISSSLVRSLVDAELFARGHGQSRERQRVVGVPKRDLARLLDEGARDRRAADPLAITESIGEDVLRQFVLEEDVETEAAEAHRLADLHFFDLGTPLCARHVTLSAAALLSAHLRGESASRPTGARRFVSAIAEAVAAHGFSASRTFTIEDANVYFAPFVDRLDEDALFHEARELLLSPAIRAYPRRGGLLRLELVLCSEVPSRLHGRDVPPPAPPGATWDDFDDAALRVARALIAVAGALRREGAGATLPDLTLVLPRSKARDAATRALVRDAVALAAEAGEPVFLFDALGLPARGGRALRAAQSDLADPLRFLRGDVSVGTAGAINLVAPALRRGRGALDAYLDDVGRLAGLAVSTAAARRRRLARGGESPDGSLWRLRRGVEPLLDADGAIHVVDLVGLRRAAAIVAPAPGEASEAGAQDRILARIRGRAIEEARRHDLVVVVTQSSDPEASHRFAETDAERFDVVRSWFADGEETYRPSLSEGRGQFLEPASVVLPRSDGQPLSRRVRVDSDRRPDVDALVVGLEASSNDVRIVEHRIDPWPRRHVRLPD